MHRLQKHSATELYTAGPFEELLVCELSQWPRRAKQEATEELSKCFPYHRRGLTDDNEKTTHVQPNTWCLQNTAMVGGGPLYEGSSGNKVTMNRNHTSSPCPQHTRGIRYLP